MLVIIWIVADIKTDAIIILQLIDPRLLITCWKILGCGMLPWYKYNFLKFVGFLDQDINSLDIILDLGQTVFGT